MMDNFRFDIMSVGTENLEVALSIGFRGDNGKSNTYATHYAVWDSKDLGNRMTDRELPITFVLYKDYEGRGVIQTDAGIQLIPFPCPMTLESVVPMVQQWLNGVDYGNEPDHDGINKPGWRVFNEQWGFVFGNQNAIAGIQPLWAEFGK